MKNLIAAALIVSSFSAFAGVEELLGTYKAKDRDGTAVITRTLVQDRTLFEPAVYEYQAEIVRNKHDIERTIILEIGADKNSLSGSERDDCDNPDCHAFDNFDVEVKKIGRGAQLTLTYDGHNTSDENDDVETFEGKATFLKK